MGKQTVLRGQGLTLTTAVRVLAAFRTAAVGSNASNVFLTRLEIGQRSTTTLAQVGCEIALRDTAGTLTATSSAPQATRPASALASGLTGNTAPAGGDARSGINATVDSGGTYTTLHPFEFPNTAGYLWIPPQGKEIWIPPSTVCVVRFVADPSNLTLWTFELELDEN